MDMEDPCLAPPKAGAMGGYLGGRVSQLKKTKNEMDIDEEFVTLQAFW